MGRKSYQRGANFERRIMRELEALGYSCNTRSAGSHGLIDVWAYHPARCHFRLIQAKREALCSRRIAELERELRRAGLVSKHNVLVQIAFLGTHTTPESMRRIQNIVYYTLNNI